MTLALAWNLCHSLLKLQCCHFISTVLDGGLLGEGVCFAERWSVSGGNGWCSSACIITDKGLVRGKSQWAQTTHTNTSSSSLPDRPPTSIFFRFLASRMTTVSLPAVGTYRSEKQMSPSFSCCGERRSPGSGPGRQRGGELKKGRKKNIKR